MVQFRHRFLSLGGVSLCSKTWLQKTACCAASWPNCSGKRRKTSRSCSAINSLTCNSSQHPASRT